MYEGVTEWASNILLYRGGVVTEEDYLANSIAQKILVDERYTSAAASSVLDNEGIHGRKQKSLIDQYAAQQILQAYFDEPSAGSYA